MWHAWQVSVLSPSVACLQACTDKMTSTEDVRLPDGRTLRLEREADFGGGIPELGGRKGAVMRIIRLRRHCSVVGIVLAIFGTQLDVGHAGPLAPPRSPQQLECLDTVCPGEVSPEHGADSAALKINGQWYLGPAGYFTPNEAVFYWPGKQPGFSRDAPDAVKQGHFYEHAVEIFLHRDFDAAMSMERQLREMEKTAHVLEKRDMPTGVRVWRTRDAAGIEQLWYEIRTATAPGGERPIVACQVEPAWAKCTGGFRLRPGVVADFRFPSAFGSGWLEIYREAVRVLKLLKEA